MPASPARPPVPPVAEPEPHPAGAGAAAPRRCLVTGANRGLGLEFTRQLLAGGDRVIATCRAPGRAHALNQLAGEHPGRLHILPLDVCEARSRHELVRELPLVLGDTERVPAALDLVINNAGVLHSGERFGCLDPARLDHAWHTNALGPLLLTEALAPSLAQGARVVNISSLIGSIASVEAFRTPGYALSKAALNMATALLAWAPPLVDRGVVVLAVNPGWVRTDMGGADAQALPEDAVRDLLAVIAGSRAADSGSFLGRDGNPAPW